MINLPKLPKITPGVRYPEGQLEEQFDAVKKTNPNDYMREIKSLMKDINSYKECLELQGYSVKELETCDPDKVFAKKELIIR